MSAIVVDVGCKAHEGEVSIPKLVARFNPRLLLGFDPHPELNEGLDHILNATIVTRRAAAWVCQGTLAFEIDGSSSHASVNGNTIVPCFDLAALIRMLPPVGVTLKLDVEGAEYRLLTHLLRTGTDRLIGRLLVEWHELDREHRPGQRDRLLRELRCPVEDWE